MSLIDCLRKIGLEDHYKAIVGLEGPQIEDEAARRDRTGEKDAAHNAVLAYIQELQTEHKDVVGQIQARMPDFHPLHNLPLPGEETEREQSQDQTPQAGQPEAEEVTPEQPPTLSDEALRRADSTLDRPSAPGSKWTYREVQREAEAATRASQVNLGREPSEETEGEPGEASADSTYITRTYYTPDQRSFVPEQDMGASGYKLSPLSSVWKTLALFQHFGDGKRTTEPTVTRDSDGSITIDGATYTRKQTPDGYEMVGEGGQQEATYRLVKKAERWVIEKESHGRSIEGQEGRVSEELIKQALAEGHDTARGLMLGHVGKESVEGPPKDFIAFRTTDKSDPQKIHNDFKFTPDWLKSNQGAIPVAAKTLRKIGALLTGQDNTTPGNAKRNVQEAMAHLMSTYGLELASERGLETRVIWTPKDGKPLTFGEINLNEKSDRGAQIEKDLRAWKDLLKRFWSGQKPEVVLAKAKERYPALVGSDETLTRDQVQGRIQQLEAELKGLGYDIETDEMPEREAGQGGETEASPEQIRNAVKEQNLANRPLKRQQQTEIPTQGQITNKAPSLPKALVDWVGDWLQEIGVTTRLTITDEPPAVVDPRKPWFIANDAKSRDKREHIIYIPKDYEPQTQVEALLHELGHFLQRNVLDGLIESATSQGDKRAQQLLSEVIGVPDLEAYFQLSNKEKDVVDERFGDMLAIAALRKGSSLTAKGKTVRDVLAADNATTFFDRLAGLLHALWNQIKTQAAKHKLFVPNAKSQLKSFEQFIEAMTGRNKAWAETMQAHWSKTLQPRARSADRVQAMNPLKFRAAMAKLKDSTSIDRALGLWRRLLSANRQLMTTPNRDGTGKSQFTQRLAKAFKRYDERLRFHHGAFINHAMALLDQQPYWDQEMPTKKTPKGYRAAGLVHGYLIRQTPLSQIPHTKIVVERLHNGRKDVEVDVHELVKAAREAMDFNLQYANKHGLKIERIRNYWPRQFAVDKLKENKSLQEEFIRLLKRSTKQKVWHGDREVEVQDDAWSEEDAKAFLDRLIHQDLEYPFTLDRLLEGRGDTDEEIGKLLDDPMKMKLWGPTEQSHKHREFPEARWVQMMHISSALTSEVYTQRSAQLAKYIAVNEEFGGGIVMAPGDKEPRILSRDDYLQYHREVNSAIEDSVLVGHGLDHLTADRILEGDDERIQARLWANRADQLRQFREDKEISDWMDKEWERIAGKDMYDPLAKIEVELSRAYKSGDIGYADAIRVKSKIVAAYLGRLGQRELPAGVRSLQSYLLSAMGVSMLPWAVLSSLAEVTQIGTRMYEPALQMTGKKAHGIVLKTLYDSIASKEGQERYKAFADMAKALGIVQDYALEHALAATLEAEYMPLNVRKFNASFFRATGLKSWTDMTRTISLMLGTDAIQSYARAALKGDQAALVQLKHLELTPQDVVDWVTAPDRDDVRAHPKIATALGFWVNEATLRPRAATRPVFGSDPRFALVWFLKDFPWAMFAGTMSYVYRQSKYAPTRLARMTPWLVAAIPMMLAGALGQWLKDELSNQLPAAALGVKAKEYKGDGWDRVVDAAKRSGIMGPGEMIWQTGENMAHRGLPWIGVVSPAASILQDAAIRGSGPTILDRIPGFSWFSRPVREAMWGWFGVK